MSDHDNDTCPHLVRASLLEAENAHLKTENEELHKDYEALADEHTKLIDRNAILKAEVERLRKAGDELERVLISRSGSYEAGNASHEWQSAKGGQFEGS